MTAMSDNQLSCKEMIAAKASRIRPHIGPFLYMVILLMFLYAASVVINPGWITWLLSSTALAVCGGTALARLDDISADQVSKRWQVRRAGLVLVSAAAFGIALSDVGKLVFQGVAIVDFPSWKEVVFRWGVALTWITTPHMPPWWRYITGEFRTVQDARKAAAAMTISGLYPTGEHQAYVSTELAKAVAAVEELAPEIKEPLPNPRGRYERWTDGDKRGSVQ